MKTLITTLWTLALLAPSVFAQEAIDIGDRRELFVDRTIVESLIGLDLQLNTPSYAGPAIQFDEPWEGRFCGYPTVIHDGDLYRMYYRGIPEAGSDGRDEETTCYAESTDGINWTKPNLGIYEVNGTKDNSVILYDAAPYTHNFAPFLDTNPDADPSARFKALAGTSGGNKERGEPGGLYYFASPDGIHWKKAHDKPIITQGAFDSQNVGFWSETEQKYICYLRIFESGVRSVARCTSDDFITWTTPEPMTYGGTKREHLYTQQTIPYFRAPHIYIALPMRFFPGRAVLTKEQAASLGVHVSDKGPSYASDCADTVFMTTRGGTLYDRTFMEGFIRPGTDLGNWASRAGMAAHGVVQTGPTELSIYKQFHYAQPSAFLGRYTIRLDGFTSLHAPYQEGSATTKPITFKGNALYLNFATSAAGTVHIGLRDANGAPIEGFTTADCDDVIGDDVDRRVSWKGNSDVSALAGKPVRLEFTMSDADLYSFQFRTN